MPEPRKPRVVIADDENHIRVLFKTVMKTMNTEVVAEAKNGREAADLYKQEKPDLILLDINMPVMDGREALREIMGESPDAFVIMLTSVADAETIRETLKLGASNYILKDTPLPEMKKIIKETWEAFRKKG
ncbi:MAG: response regulator [Proteobacteria bacterium]|nr:response regulator [Pseudomonadota bacterium]